eukprot:2712553-Prymnesium_polylepis.1
MGLAPHLRPGVGAARVEAMPSRDWCSTRPMRRAAPRLAAAAGAATTASSMLACAANEKSDSQRISDTCLKEDGTKCVVSDARVHLFECDIDVNIGGGTYIFRLRLRNNAIDIFHVHAACTKHCVLRRDTLDGQDPVMVAGNHVR